MSSNNKTEFCDIHGGYVEEIQPGSMWECKQFIDSWNNVAGMQLHGQDNWTVQFLSDLYHGEKPPNIEFSDINTMYIDIETQSEYGFPDVDDPCEMINAITMRTNDVTYVLGVGKFDIPSRDGREFRCFEFECEEDLLNEFINLWNIIDPDVITGWHSTPFDIPYLIARITRLFGEDHANKLSPWGKIWKKSVKDDYGNMRTAYVIYGIAQLDFMQLYKKYVLAPRESYKLDFIAGVEVGHKKIDWHEKYDTMKEFYDDDFQLFMEYNVVDVDLIYMMEQKLRLLELQTQIAYTAKVNYDDVFSPVRTWDAIIYNHLREDDIVIPMLTVTEKRSQYAGAYVMEPVPGMYECVASYDLASLYPSILIMMSVSPENIILRGELEGFKQRLQRRLESC